MNVVYLLHADLMRNVSMNLDHINVSIGVNLDFSVTKTAGVKVSHCVVLRGITLKKYVLKLKRASLREVSFTM